MRAKTIFFHIPKTAGSTFKQILMNEYAAGKRFEIVVKDKVLMTDSFIQLPKKEKENLDLLYGHMKFGLHEYFDTRVKYITLLRDPVKRVISNYYYLLRSPFHVNYDYVKSNNLSLKEYVESGINPSLNNTYMKFVSNKDEVNDEIFDDVIQKMETHFSVVGITEYFDESILLMKHKLGWNKIPYYRSTNISTNKDKQRDFEELGELIREKNTYDIKLYNYFVNKFKEEKLFLSDDKIRRFKKFNSYYNEKWFRYPIKGLRKII